MVTLAPSQGRYATLDSNLGLLQEMVRKDPESYRDEFESRVFHFQQRIRLFEFDTQMHRKDVHILLELVTFISGVANHFPEEGKQFAQQLTHILTTVAPGLEPDVRLAFCKAMVTLRNKKIVSDDEIFELFFEIVKCEDKNLRKFILGGIVSFIKQNSKHCADRKMESRIQNFVISKLQDSRSVVARTAQLVLVDAFRRNYWRQAKIVNALAECVFHKSARLQTVSMRFFLGSLKDEEGYGSESDNSDAEGKKEEQKTIKEVMTAFRFAKKTKKRQKNLEKTKKALTKEEKEKKESRSKYCNLQAIQMLFDAQSFVDRLFAHLESKKNEKFVIRLQQIALCARVIGIHRLQTLGFYSYIHRYLQPKQREVTRILLYAAQACHELVPPDLVENLVRVIANNFVSDRNTPEGITVGINAIREIFSNCPFAATEELLQELCEFKSFKNKNVSMAARGLIALFRSVNPKLLSRKNRGRPTDARSEIVSAGPLEFGAPRTVDYIPGAEVLPEEADSQEEEEVPGSDESDWMDVDSGDEETQAVDDSDEDAGDAEDDGDNEAEDEWVTDDDEEVEGEEGDSEVEMDDEAEDDEEEEEEEEEVEAEKPTPKERKLNKGQKKVVRQKTRIADDKAMQEKARMISATRILTDADFRRIRSHQLKKQVGATSSNDRKRTNDEIKLDEELEEKRAKREEGDGLPRLNDILHFHKKLRRETKEERLKSAQEGREGREEFGKPKKKGPHVGRTNREMAKHKDFRMVRQKVRGRNRQRSFRDRQQSLRKYLLRQSGRKPQ